MPGSCPTSSSQSSHPARTQSAPTGEPATSPWVIARNCLIDLASLRGPSRGTVELSLRLYWSGLSPVFDLEDPDMRRWLYQIVLGKPAGRRT